MRQQVIEYAHYCSTTGALVLMMSRTSNTKGLGQQSRKRVAGRGKKGTIFSIPPG